MQSLPLYSSCLNEDNVDIVKPDGICSHTFIVDQFLGLLLHL